MAFHFKNLTFEIRDLMVREVEYDIQNGVLYLSSRLSGYGQVQYPKLLLENIRNGNEETLAASLYGCFNLQYPRKKPNGGVTLVKMPENANLTLAEGEFNRFYIRALCVFAQENGKKLRIYRAKVVNNPRIESQIRIGQIVHADMLLNDLRKDVAVDKILGVPSGPNSGLSVELVD